MPDRPPPAARALPRAFPRLLVWCSIAFFLFDAAVALVHARAWVDRPFAGFLVGKACNVYPLTAPGWEYHRLGLRAHDRIVAVDGTRVDKHDRFLELVRAKAPGSAVRYDVERDGRAVAAQGKIGTFGLADFVFVFLLPYLIGLAFLAIGATVFLLKSSFGAAGLFSLFCSAVGLFFVNFFDAYADIRLTILLDIGLNLAPALMVHLALVFPERARAVAGRRWPLAALYGVNLAVFAGKLFFELRDYGAWTALDTLGDGLLVGSYGALLARLGWKAFRASTSILRKRAQLALTGLLLAFLALGVSIGLGASSLNLPALLTLIFPFYLGFAIVRHNMFDAEQVLVNSLFYTLLSAGGLLLFLALSAVTGTMAFGAAAGLESYAGTLVLMIVFGTVAWMRQRFQRLVDRFFHRARYDAEQLLARVSTMLRSLFRFTAGTESALQAFLAQLGITRAAVFFYGPPGAPVAPFYDFDLVPGQPVFAVAAGTREFLAAARGPLTPHDLEERELPAPLFADLAGLFARTRALLLLPIGADDRALGFLLLAEKASGRAYRGTEVDMLSTLAAHLGNARVNAELLDRAREQERLEQELAIATGIQQRFLPASAAPSPRYELAFHYRPARHVGGDLYDFFQQPEDRLGVVIGDVSGKGLPAALFGAVSSGIMKAGWEQLTSVAAFVGEMNRQVSRIRFGKMNIALGVALFDFSAGRLTCANAGLPYPIHRNAATGEAGFVRAAGMPLATRADQRYAETSLPLAPGDAYLFYSDGLVEVEDGAGELYGFDRLAAAVGRLGGGSAADLLAGVLEEVRGFQHDIDPADDQTVIAVRILPA